MDSQKQQALFRRHPKLFRLALAPAGEQGCMAQGLPDGDGWFGLIARISEAVDEVSNRHELTNLEWPMAVEVKEKFGELRFLIRFECEASRRQLAAREEINHAKERLSRLSQHICQRCGAPGGMRKQGWWHVYCDHCEGLYVRGLT